MNEYFEVYYEPRNETIYVSEKARNAWETLHIRLKQDPCSTLPPSVLFRTILFQNFADITTRDISQYPCFVQNHRIDPSLQYIEVGAGLGEFIEHILQANPQRRPIVIDPANFPRLQRILAYAVQLDIPQLTLVLRERISLCLNRCTTILDSQKVRLIPVPLEEALEFDPSLAACGDVVVDHFATEQYSPNRTIARGIRQKLLKAKGLLCT